MGTENERFPLRFPFHSIYCVWASSILAFYGWQHFKNQTKGKTKYYQEGAVIVILLSTVLTLMIILKS